MLEDKALQTLELEDSMEEEMEVMPVAVQVEVGERIFDPLRET